MDSLSILNILEAFNAPITEEQAWAVCHQCATYLHLKRSENLTDALQAETAITSHLLDENSKQSNGVITVQSLMMSMDGDATSMETCQFLGHLRILPESEVVRALGVVVFHMLDYGLSETEEQTLSAELQQLIERMTADDAECDDDGDEGITKDSDSLTDKQHLTLSDVIQLCVDHMSSKTEAADHYKAVCRALAAEAVELTTFLEKISTTGKEIDTSSEECSEHLTSLKRNDWARLWIQIMKELRQGVKLKKVERLHEHQSMEYELTPYEIMMNDVRSHRYMLNKVVDGEKMMPLQVKKDVHAIILEFIRSRPPLHPVSARKLQEPPVKSPDAHEELLKAIRSNHTLRPTPGRLVDSSRIRLDDKEPSPAATKKIIKPDLSLLAGDSSDDDMDVDGDGRNHVAVTTDTAFTPLSPKTPPKLQTWDVTDESELNDNSAASQSDKRDRRHSVTLCQMPAGNVHDDRVGRSSLHPCADRFLSADIASKVSSLQSSIECVSLTVEEVMHIRYVLTKAELECLLVEPELHELLATGKVCFCCKKTRFALFGLWATSCRFCRRNVCSQCVGKMRIPSEHFEHIPVYTLSPGTPTDDDSRTPSSTHGSGSSSPKEKQKIHPDATPSIGQTSLLLTSVNQCKKALLQRSQTIIQRPSSATLTRQRSVNGQMMNVCHDCRAMIASIVQASRRSMSVVTPSFVNRTYSCRSERPARNFHLDLKAVYRGK